MGLGKRLEQLESSGLAEARSNTFPATVGAGGLTRQGDGSYAQTHDFRSVATAGGAKMAKIKSGSGSVYIADIYGDGPEATATELNAIVKIMQVPSGEALPVNSWILVAG